MPSWTPSSRFSAIYSCLVPCRLSRLVGFHCYNLFSSLIRGSRRNARLDTRQAGFPPFIYSCLLPCRAGLVGSGRSTAWRCPLSTVSSAVITKTIFPSMFMSCAVSSRTGRFRPVHRLALSIIHSFFSRNNKISFPFNDHVLCCVD